jgi:hypothetical protein
MTVSLKVMNAAPTSFGSPCDNHSLPTSDRRLVSCQNQELSKTVTSESLECGVVWSAALGSFVCIILVLQLLQLFLEARFKRSQLVIAGVKLARGVQIPVAVCLYPQRDGDRHISEANHHLVFANVCHELVGDMIKRTLHVRILVGVDDEILLPVHAESGVERALALVENAATSPGKSKR